VSHYSPLLELANYHVLGRILYYVPHFAPIDPSKVLSIFGALSVVVEALNSIGVSFRANTKATQSHQALGEHLTTAALVLQLVVIAIFVVLATIFHRRCAKANIHTKAVSAPLNTLYISTSLIFIRCIYRLVEQFGNTTVDLDDLDALKALSPVLRHEWFFYVFEATLMLANSVLWNVRSPGRHLPGNYRIYLALDGTTELEGEDKSDNRSLLATLIDPLGLILRKKKDNGPILELNDLPAADSQR
jgi:RTA1 like protein